MKLKVEAILDKEFTPMMLVYREFTEAAKAAGAQRLVIGIERNKGYVSAFETVIFKDGTGHDEENYEFVERLVKSLLWVRGGHKIIIAGSKSVADKLKLAYSPLGARSFDFDFMSGVYETTVTVEYRPIEEAPVTSESATPVGRHLDGCRIGFDAGGSDRKVSAVIDGECVYSEEVVWFPKTNSDPDYHYDGILSAMKSAAEHMPRVDAIGVSSAGVYVDNRIMVASLFLKVGKEDFEKKCKTMYIDVAKEFGDVPLEVANDGDVTALAGAMDLNDNNVLGIAMGTSEAGGYVDGVGNITGWLNELAFVPCDYSKDAMVDEWSGDYGCGVKYFSQDAVIKLAEAGGFKFEDGLTPAQKLKVIQALVEKDDALATQIYEDIGTYLAHTIPFYARFYDIKHMLLLGRVMGGKGGDIILKTCDKVLAAEYPAFAAPDISLPDEQNRRVGQSIAAASLPADLA